MTKYPREEISYKKLYKNLNLNRDLDIKWPEIQENGEVCVVDEDKITEMKKEEYVLDEFDLKFCDKNNVKPQELQKLFEKLDESFISYIFDKLDKVQIEKTKNPCDICGSNSNINLISCDGCGISVHEACYGVFETPGKRWLCKKCIFHYEKGFCKYCNNTNGILKKVDAGGWGHVICALLIPGMSFCNMNARDPIEESTIQGCEGNCNICNEFSKFLIKCGHGDCNLFFHASCAGENLYCDIGNVITYCDEHNPLNERKKIQSRRHLLMNFDSYPELTNDIIIRKIQKLQKPKKYQYLKIVTKKPKIIGLEDGDKNLMKYWIKKRRSFGYYFEDLFKFSNYFLNKSGH